MFHEYRNALWYIKTRGFIYIKSQTWHDFLAECKEEISTELAASIWTLCQWASKKVSLQTQWLALEHFTARLATCANKGGSIQH